MAKTNKERLICIEAKVDQVITGLNNHLEDHKASYNRLFRVFLVVLGAILAAATAVLVLIIKAS